MYKETFERHQLCLHQVAFIGGCHVELDPWKVSSIPLDAFFLCVQASKLFSSEGSYSCMCARQKIGPVGQKKKKVCARTLGCRCDADWKPKAKDDTLMCDLRYE